MLPFVDSWNLHHLSWFEIINEQYPCSVIMSHLYPHIRIFLSVIQVSTCFQGVRYNNVFSYIKLRIFDSGIVLNLSRDEVLFLNFVGPPLMSWGHGDSDGNFSFRALFYKHNFLLVLILWNVSICHKVILLEKLWWSAIDVLGSWRHSCCFLCLLFGFINIFLLVLIITLTFSKSVFANNSFVWREW